MPVRDAYHDTVTSALVRDGWTITDDPLHLRLGDRDSFVDLGAERLIAAQREELRIAVEIKSFLGPSEFADLQQAMGQYVMYYEVLQRTDPDRRLYLAVSEEVKESVFAEPIGGILLESNLVKLLVFDPEREEIIEWLPQQPLNLSESRRFEAPLSPSSENTPQSLIRSGTSNLRSSLTADGTAIC